MNPTLKTIFNRKSIRAYETEPLSDNEKRIIIDAALRSPTAGNMMLYSIIEVTRQQIKDTLAKTCDNQPFIAKAPFVLIFLADYQRWTDYFTACDIETFCKNENLPVKTPAEGDLFLACCDALIAAQTAVLAAQSIGIGSCYIGDIMENYEIHQELFDLPPYVFPITMVCFGRPTAAQEKRKTTSRFDREFICFQDKYRRFDAPAFKTMFDVRHKEVFGSRKEINGASSFGRYMYKKKYTADFTLEMNRSVKKILSIWLGQKTL